MRDFGAKWIALVFIQYLLPMYLQVVAMRFHGKALEQSQIRAAKYVCAEVIVAHENSGALGTVFRCRESECRRRRTGATVACAV
jgi:hypothetical protein